MIAQPITTPLVGEEWPEQGGTYAGSRMISGQLRHLIMLGCGDHDLKRLTFGECESAVAGIGWVNGHNDWRAPTLHELTQAWALLPDSFYGGYWSTDPHLEKSAWALVVNDMGCTCVHDREVPFAVRPVRLVSLEARSFAGADDAVIAARRPADLDADLRRLRVHIEDLCLTKVTQLVSLIDMINLGGMDTFRELSDDLQEGYMNIASDIALDLRSDLAKMAKSCEREEQA